MRARGAAPFCIAAAALLLSAVAPPSVAAQRWGVSPFVLLDGGPTAGLRFDVDVRRDRDMIGPYPRSLRYAFSVDGAYLLDEERNSETIRSLIDVGYLISLFRPSTPVGAIPSPDDPPPWNRGWVALQLGAGIEAPQDWSTSDFTVGGSLEYGHDQYQTLWFLPEARVEWGYVRCVDCDTTTADAEDAGSRMQGELAWSIPADREWMPSPLRPLWLRLQGRGFATSGLDEVGALRNEDGMWGSAELAYRCDGCGPLHEVYVRGFGGQLPIAMEDEVGVGVGASLAF